MIHKCNIHCHAVDIDKAEMMGLEDKGRWMPFAFRMEMVVSCKLTSDDEETLTNNCTTIFTEHGDTYIIDTPYIEFERLFIDYNDMLPPADMLEDDNTELDF